MFIAICHVSVGLQVMSPNKAKSGTFSIFHSLSRISAFPGTKSQGYLFRMALNDAKREDRRSICFCRFILS